MFSKNQIERVFLTDEISEEFSGDRIKAGMTDFVETFISSIRNGTGNEFYEELKHIDDMTEAIRNYLDFEGDLEKEKIYYFGVLEAVIYAAQQLQFDKNVAWKEAFDNENVKKILEHLYNAGALESSRLAQSMNIRDKELEEIMCRAENCQLWKCRDDQFYFLTKHGKDVYCRIRQKAITKENEKLEAFPNIFTKRNENSIKRKEKEYVQQMFLRKKRRENYRENDIYDDINMNIGVIMEEEAVLNE